MTQTNKLHPSFVVALPMYNEEAYAEKCIRAIFPVLDGIKPSNAVVAINDGSRDNTLSILEGLTVEYERLHIVDHHVNRGYGAAIKSAYEFGIGRGFDYVLFMDADLTQDPHCIPDFLPHMVNRVEFIKASRYVKGSRVIGVPYFRAVISTLGNAFARFAFQLPITDYTNGFRAVSTELAGKFRLSENHFAILVEEMWQAKHLAKSYAEVSYSLSARANAEDSKFNYNLNVYKLYLKYCLFSLLRISPKSRKKYKDEKE